MKYFRLPSGSILGLIRASIHAGMNRHMDYKLREGKHLFIPRTRAAELWLMLNVPEGAEILEGPWTNS